MRPFSDVGTGPGYPAHRVPGPLPLRYETTRLTLLTSRFGRESAVAAVQIGVVRETAPGERRVAAVPAMVSRLRQLGVDVLVETEAGAGAFLPDSG